MRARKATRFSTTRATTAAKAGRVDGFSTVQLNVNFIRAIRPGEGTATIESRLVRQGRRIIVAEAEMRSADGRLCAIASATCMPGG
ncbi:MAG TPA: PaaI family thioesterase [Candidatus Eisenbacteria bacterium]|nr:PaaI family thioesterase [Candidatus Eisenbacteria bacterium]